MNFWNLLSWFSEFPVVYCNVFISFNCIHLCLLLTSIWLMVCSSCLSFKQQTLLPWFIFFHFLFGFVLPCFHNFFPFSDWQFEIFFLFLNGYHYIICLCICIVCFLNLGAYVCVAKDVRSGTGTLWSGVTWVLGIKLRFP